MPAVTRRVRLPQTVGQFWQTPTGTAVLALMGLTRMYTLMSVYKTNYYRALLGKPELSYAEIARPRARRQQRVTG